MESISGPRRRAIFPGERRRNTCRLGEMTQAVDWSVSSRKRTFQVPDLSGKKKSCNCNKASFSLGGRVHTSKCVFWSWETGRGVERCRAGEGMYSKIVRSGASLPTFACWPSPSRSRRRARFLSSHHERKHFQTLEGSRWNESHNTWRECMNARNESKRMGEDAECFSPITNVN